MIYLKILKFNFLQFIHYPLELVASLVDEIFKLALFIIFWRIVIEAGGNGSYSLNDLISYMLISKGLSTVTMFLNHKFGSHLRNKIYDGTITNNIMQPVPLIPALYVELWGSRALNNIPAILFLAIGIAMRDETTIYGFLSFGLFAVVAFMIGFAFNLLKGVLAFYFTNVSGIMASIIHTTRVFSGQLIPLDLFPTTLFNIASVLPFAAAIYGPIKALDAVGMGDVISQELIVGAAWAVLLNVILIIWWQKGLKQYEAVGL